MKNITFLLGLAIILGILISSCSKTEEDPTDPKISFMSGAEYVNNDTILPVSTFFKVGFNASSTSDKDLSSIKLTRTYEIIGNPEEVFNFTLSSSSFSFDTTLAAHPNEGDEKFICTVSDKNGLSSSVSFTITTVAGDPGIYIYNDVNLGSFNSNTNSSFASITGQTFSQAEALSDTIVQQKIDWCYFDGDTYGHTLMSPVNDEILNVYDSIVSWDYRNNTKFEKTTYEPGIFDGIENSNQLTVIIYNANLSFTSNFFSEKLSNPGEFEVNDIIAFQTNKGKRGLIKVTEVNPGATNGESTIKYDLKVLK
ncbi:MAG: hypothetical protein B6D61_14230 [Bacteroidetes bacterium 4484_249]|nr:MAG: hypothetical protein B6D61_14230 [Bacteroidetes bacterium 4484_249]